MEGMLSGFQSDLTNISEEERAVILATAVSRALVACPPNPMEFIEDLLNSVVLQFNSLQRVAT